MSSLASFESAPPVSTLPVQRRQIRLNSSDLLIVGLLAATELLCFGLLVKHIGFYLDDWATFCQLHFAPNNFLEVLKASLSDPRMITRPFQCLYYASTYMFFGDNPIGYQILRCIIEFFGGAFLYLTLLRVLQQRLPATLAGLFFILHPARDASHYWIGAGLGAGCGSTLFLLSLWLAVEGRLRCSRTITASAALSFFLCAYCYEAFLPMLSLTFLCIFWLNLHQYRPRSAAVHTLRYLAPFVLIGISEPIYQRMIVPLFSKTFLSPSTLNLQYALNVFVQGLSVTAGPAGWLFFAERAREAAANITPAQTGRLIALVLASVSAAVLAWRNDSKQLPAGSPLNNISTRGYWALSSLLVLLCSYLTFAVAAGYTPTLSSIINRVNAGATIAAAILTASLIAPPHLTWQRSRLIPVAFLCTTLTAFFVLADWGFAPHWIQSWTVQKAVAERVAERAHKMKDGDTLLLTNTPRYVMWAPVFDGVWDFQSLVWMKLNNKNVKAGVISERMEVKHDSVDDYSAGFLCASYPYRGMSLLVPNGNQLIDVSSAKQFIEAVEHNGMDFGFCKSRIQQWKRSLQSDFSN